MKFKALAFFLFVLLIFILIPRLIKINRISCSSQYGPCRSDILDKLAEAKGKDIIQALRMSKNILKSESGVSEFRVSYSFPDVILVTLREEKAVFAFRKTVDRGFTLFSSEGKMLGYTESTGLPRVYSDEDPTNLQKLSKLMQTLFVVYGVTEAEMKENYLKVNLHDRGLVAYISLDRDVDVSLGSLDLILSRLKEGGNYSIIDLRYRNPILK